MSGAKILNHMPPPTYCASCHTLHSIAERCPTPASLLMAQENAAREAVRVLVEDVHFAVDLTDAEALALAQFVKRVTWRGLRDCALDDGECGTMRTAICKLQNALADEGYAPR